jgi:hypothetical protein
VNVAINHIGTQLCCGEHDRKPIAVYGGPMTGKSMVMSVLLTTLKADKKYLPVRISLKQLAPRDVIGYSGKYKYKVRENSSSILFDVVMSELVANGIVASTQRLGNWDHLDKALEQIAEKEAKTFVLLLDDLPFLECPLTQLTESLLLNMFTRKRNRCLVFSSCIPVFAGVRGLPCIPTARIENLDSTEVRPIAPACSCLYEHVQHFASVPALAYAVCKDPSVEDILRYHEDMLRTFPQFKSLPSQPINAFVCDLFYCAVPSSFQYFSQAFACVKTYGRVSCVYWPPVVIAMIFRTYIERSKLDRLSSYAAGLFYESIQPLTESSPHPNLAGPARSWAIVVRMSMLLWVIRMNGCLATCRQFIHNIFFGDEVSVPKLCVPAVQLVELDYVSLENLKCYLDNDIQGLNAIHGDVSITVWLLPNYDGNCARTPVIAEYNGIICVKDDDGSKTFVGLLTNEGLAPTEQPDWIHHSVLILPNSARPNRDRESELTNGRWTIWTERLVKLLLGSSLQMFYPPKIN